jgi:ferritin-like protein
MANSVGYHESEDKLTPEIQDKHRALTSMMEELEAADWYDQRVAAAADPELKQILAHNRDEEKEHFVMLLEWYRRRDGKMSHELQTRLFSSGSIVAQEQADKGETTGGAAPDASAGSLGIGSLRGGEGL